MACEERITSGEVTASHRRRGRPRSSGAERAILLAAGRLLEERGVRRMSMEAVAAAARVSKATIYRRWPSKDALIVDLIAGADGDDPPEEADPAAPPAAREELLGWVRAGLEAERSPLGEALQHLVRRAAEDGALAARLMSRVLERHRERLRAIVQRGIASGQIRADVDVDALADLVGGPLLYRHLIASTGSDVREPQRQAVAIVELLWPGIRSETPDGSTPAAPAR